MPNKVNMRKWVAALRSGDFKQGRTYLNSLDEYCCLGVVCEIAYREGVVSRREVFDDVVNYDREDAELPDSVCDWLDLDWGLGEGDGEENPIRINPIISVRPQEGHEIPVQAIYANDHLLWSFDRIADEIEEYYQLTEVDDG